MATTAERNARIDALVTATKSWAVKRRKELTDRSASAKRILKGRTGSERLAQTAVQAATTVVVAEIEEFLLTT